MSAGYSTIDEIRALAQQMSANPADAMALASQLAELVRRLPPDASELLSRPRFDRGSLWTLGAQFESVAYADVTEVPSQVIRVPRDLWVRGVSCQVTPRVTQDWLASRLRPFLSALNGRELVELGWKIDSRQGFVSSGTAEILASASQITGDGEWSSPLDWQLEQNQTIEVRARSMLADLYTVQDDEFPQSLRLITVAFWCEDMGAPSAQ